MDIASVSELFEHGLVSDPDAVVEIRESIGDPHSGPGGRSYRVCLAGGLAFEVLLERGLDIGALWCRGLPVAWRSPLRAAGPDTAAAGGWVGRFTGGMLATCGLDNIGRARDTYGQHGTHHQTRAVDVVVRRTTAPAGVVISGTVPSASVFGRQLLLHREISSTAGRAAVTVRDTIVNEGITAEAVSLLYHLNFGAPFLTPGVRVRAPAERHIPRDDDLDWQVFPQPLDAVGEVVWEHAGFDGQSAGVVVHSPAVGMYAEVTWDAAVLPRCFQWIYPARRGWALAVEPANAPLFGPDRELPHAGAPVLAPGGRIEAGFTLALHDEKPPR
ncbi:DUF4432 family protein [Micromonospora tulbaghiae]|uniref:DUF4432 family protein n=1 Tax=Micromonospora tulbaghiae TaxID=479978 RepID=UPI003445AAB8